MESGKFYFEGKVTTNAANGYSQIGITTYPEGETYPGANSSFDLGFGWYSANGQLYYQSNVRETYSSWTVGDTVAVAYDATTRKCWIAKNGTWQNSGDPAAGTGSVYTIPTDGLHTNPYFSIATGTNGVVVANFGQLPFEYTPPTGFKSLCTTNITDPTISDPSTAMDAVTYTGNGSSKTISGVGFSPDLIWTKCRNEARSNYLMDLVRGISKYLISEQTSAEGTNTTNRILSVTSDGWTLGTNNAFNGNNDTYVAWAWDAGTSTVTNNDGSITSNVRANTSAGFSIVSWTASTQATATVGHGLGKVPELIIAKTRDGTGNWYVFEPSLDTGGTISKTLYLNSTSAKVTVSAIWGHYDDLTSTTFGITDSAGSGTNDGEMIAYCFTSVEGFSAFGSYEGNGNSNGPFVYCGFRPRWVMYKNQDAVEGWGITDTARSVDNPADEKLEPNTSSAEAIVTNRIDVVSNGFKIRAGSGQSPNENGNTYIYAAFAEHPFKTARAR